MLDKIIFYEQTLSDRHKILDEVSEWLISVDGVEEIILSPDELKAQAETYTVMGVNIEEALKFANQSTVKIKEIGQKILKEAGVFDNEEE